MTRTPYELDLDPPLVTAEERLQRRNGVLLKWGTDPVGLGDAAPLPPFTEPLNECTVALERAERAFEKAGWRGALRVVSRTRNGQLRFPAARHAVVLALLDRRAKRAGRSLTRELAGQPGRPVAVNATIGDGSPAETADAAAAARESGFPAVKVKVGKRSIEGDSSRLEAVRDRVGDALELRVDANGAWDLATARRFLEGSRSLDLGAVEQPLPADRARDHAQLRECGPDIALDESLAVDRPAHLVAAGVADRYVLKPMALGGIDVARGLALRIQRADATPVVTSIFESVVGRTAAIHLAASLDGLPASGLATAERFETDLGEDPAPVREGHVVPPDGPGLGVEVGSRG
jgi:o-succinylbenzoate synthase